MRRVILFAAILLLTPFVYAGGLLTNTNQSAQFIRMMSRNASTGIDAVYFNPAGLIKLEDGWHFAAYSQTVFQTKPVDSSFPLLNDGYYEGVVDVPVFPTAFAVYKKDSWAFSLGVGPNAGGGAAVYERGIPSIEIPISKIVPGLGGLGQIHPNYAVTGYDVDLAFEGSSVFWGIQLGATYQVNDMFSVYGGLRYLPAKNTYQGAIRNIQVKVGDQYHPAAEWLLGAAGDFQGMADQAGQAAQGVQPIIDNGGGGYTLAQLQGAGMITADQKAAIEQGLAGVGVTSPDQMTASQIHQTFSGAQAQLVGARNELTATAGQLGDKVVDAQQTGAGFTPMIGIQFSPAENLNLALKYEMKTALSLNNEPGENDNYSNAIFSDEIKSDIPAVLGLGAGYTTGILEAQLSYTLYFNKGVDWGMNMRDNTLTREIERNGMELGLGLQFNVLDNFAFSVGGLYGDQGVAPSYQSDMSFSNPSVTTGAGIEWKLTNALTLDAGVSNTFFQDQTVTFQDTHVGPYKETYSKTTLNLAVGLSYTLFR